MLQVFENASLVARNRHLPSLHDALARAIGLIDDGHIAAPLLRDGGKIAAARLRDRSKIICTDLAELRNIGCRAGGRCGKRRRGGRPDRRGD